MMTEKERWFNFVYFADRSVQSWLDAIVFFADPTEKNAAHITLRGPFSSYKKAARIPKDITGTEVSVLGVGTFFAEGQNTVFLHCGSERLRKYWYKPDYSFNPHITLYDGPSRHFAERVLSVCSKYRLFMELEAGGVDVVKSVKGQRSLNLQYRLDPLQIQSAIGNRVEFEQAARMPEWKRLMVIDRMLSRFTGETSARRARFDDPVSDTEEVRHSAAADLNRLQQ